MDSLKNSDRIQGSENPQILTRYHKKVLQWRHLTKIYQIPRIFQFYHSSKILHYINQPMSHIQKTRVQFFDTKSKRFLVTIKNQC